MLYINIIYGYLHICIYILPMTNTYTKHPKCVSKWLTVLPVLLPQQP